MFRNIFSKNKLKKSPKCLLITPPLLDIDNCYLAMPLLTGQLLANGIDAKNLDLNIKFFKTILSAEYINKTKKLLDLKKISYDEKSVDYFINNLEKNLQIYHRYNYGDSCYAEARRFFEMIFEFVSLPYSNFKLKAFALFEENCFNGNEHFYNNIKQMSFNKEDNIFIDFFNEEIEKIKKENINFVSITIPFPETTIPAFTLARLLKEKTDIYVVLGGNFLNPEVVMKNPEIFDIYCDAVLTGDGEETIVQLVKYMDDKQDREKIPGLIYKDKKNEVHYNSPKIVTKMDDIHNLSFDGIDFNEYMSNVTKINMMISKGCYWGKCNFCRLSEKYSRYCVIKPEKVVSNMKEIQGKYNISNGFFMFQDDAIPPKYLDMLSDEILKQEMTIAYSIFGRFEKEFTRELLEKLYKSGLRCVFWGLESGSQKILNDMNKGTKLEDVSRILKDAYEVGIANKCGLIINYPTETMKEYNETLDFIKTIEKYTSFTPGNFALMKDSPIVKKCEQYGLKILDKNEDNLRYSVDYVNLNIDEDTKQKKWNNFCEFLKRAEFDIDINKNL